MNAETTPIRFWFDFISPYGYLASLRIDELAARHGRTVDWHPLLVGVTVLPWRAASSSMRRLAR